MKTSKGAKVRRKRSRGLDSTTTSEQEDLLSTRALEERLDITSRCRRRWTAAGILPVTIVGRKRYYPWRLVVKALTRPNGRVNLRVQIRIKRR